MAMQNEGSFHCIKYISLCTWVKNGPEGTCYKRTKFGWFDEVANFRRLVLLHTCAAKIAKIRREESFNL